MSDRCADKAADLVLQIASRMTDETLGGFVAKGVIEQGGATQRLAQSEHISQPSAECVARASSLT